MGDIYNLLNIGKSGAEAAQFGVRSSGQNISNVNTPGYHRRIVEQEQAYISPTQVPRLGDGVRIIGARRVVDEALDRRARNADSQSQASVTRADVLARANVTFGDIVGEGLSPALDRLLTSFDELAATPQDPVARRDVLAAADLFASEVRRYAIAIDDIRSDVDSQLQVEVAEVNSIVQEIAETNRLISEEIQPNPDLLDRRDQLVGRLAEQVDISASAREDGSVDLHLVNTGYTLVAGRFFSELEVEQQPDGALVVGNGFGGARRDLTPTLRGGKVGGLLHARDEDLAEVQDGLDGFAFEVANEVNRIHTSGYGTDGQTGRSLFEAPIRRAGNARLLKLNPQLANNPAGVAAAQSQATAAGGNGAALSLAALRHENVINGVEPVEALQGLLHQFGDKVYQAEVNAISRSEAASQLRDLQQSMSGVSLDEEISNLIRYQQAYAAAVQVMRTADELVQDLMAIKR